MEKAVRIATIWGIAALGLALWLGLMGGWLHAAQAAPLADTVPVTTTIQAAIDAAHDGDVVSIPSGTFTESLTVDKTLTLTGVSSATTIIQAVSGQRVITATSNHTLTLVNLTVTGGTSAAGGGVYVDNGNLTIVNCVIADNQANYGGGVFQDHSGRVDVIGSRIELNTTGNHGGGLYVSGSAALTNTLVLSNTAGWHGGGLHVQDGRTDLNGGLFSNNVAANGNGGAVNLNNSVSITGTQFISNAAGQEGGALLQWNAGYTVTVTNAHFEHNAAGSNGGGLSVYGNTAVTGTLVYSNSAAIWGGGLFMGPGRLTVHSSMFFGNTSNRGGGIALNSSTAQINRSIVSGNSVTTHGGGIDVWAARLRLTNVVVADNHALVGNGIYLYESPLDALHTTIARNNGGQGNGIYANCDLSSCSTVALTNTILVSHTVGITVTAGNTATLNGVLWYSNTANTGGAGAIAVTNAITGAPAFAADGYHLTSISKAINAGIAAGVATDIDGEPRDVAPDIGADEFRTCWARLNDNATDYGHVQAAVDASTLPADVVKVAGYCPGVQSRAGISQTVYISKSLTLRGGYTLTNWTTSDPTGNPTILDARQAGRVVFLTGSSGVNVTLENLTMRGGYINANGGGICDDNVTLTLSNAIVRDNVSNHGWGGGVFVQTGNATVSGGQIFSNTAWVGGGVYVQSGSTIVVSRTQILSNTASIGGGGVYINSSALLMVTDSTVSGNTGSWWGGGIVNQGSALTLTNSTLSGNQAISSTYGGGAIDQEGSSSATILNSTIVSNTAVNAARSGIWLESGTLTIQNSIVALNNGTNNVAISGGTFTSLGYNLTNSGAGTPFTATGDLANTNPLLGPLQDNGGSTWTHALLPGSPAIDRIPFGVNGCGTTITTDQRGQPRPGTFTHLCDIGAYEVQGVHFQIYLPLVIRQ